MTTRLLNPITFPLSNGNKSMLRRELKDSLKLSKNATEKKIAESLGLSSIKDIYFVAAESYNEFVDSHNNAVLTRRTEQRKEKRAMQRRANRPSSGSKLVEVNSMKALYPYVKDAYKNKKMMNVRFVLSDGTLWRDMYIDTSLPKLHELWTSILYTMVYDSVYGWFEVFDGTGQIFPGDTRTGKMFIQYGNRLVPKKTMMQSFFEGKINCVMLPILNFFNEKLTTLKTKQAIYNYRSLLKKAVALEEKYHSIGVNADALHDISNELQIDLHINLPFQKDHLVAKSNKKPLRTFQYVNTRFNHVDFDEYTHNEVDEIVTLDRLTTIQKELDTAGTYYTYRKNMTHLRQLDTINRRYKLANGFADEVYEFETQSGLIDSKVCSLRNPELSAFLRQGTHFNQTVDFCPDESIQDEDFELSSKKDVQFDNHIDMTGAYGSYKMSKYYKGFLGKITDFRECNNIVDVGIYKIENLVLNGRLKRLNRYLNCYSNNVYPSPELEMMLDEGCTFDIVAGCWGNVLDLEFSNNMMTKKDEDGIRYYCKYVGRCFCSNETQSYYIKTSPELKQHIANEVDDADVSLYDNELKVTFKKSSNYGLPHFSAFITSYMRLNMIEQLFEFDMTNVLKIVVDGIYFNGAVPPLKNCFREKKATWVACTGFTYVSNQFCDQTFVWGKTREHNMVEVHVGPGGCGKTHLNLVDTGFINLGYFAPSWKLARSKQKEYGCYSNTIAKLTSSDPTQITNMKRLTNVFVIDEVSMLSEQDKQKIMNNFAGCKLVFCGDVGFQLPCFEIESIPFNIHGMKVVKYTTNHRVKCEKLAALLSDIRELIEAGESPRWLIEQTCVKGSVKDYNYLQDMILCQTHVKKDSYKEHFSHLPKYYITKSDRVYGRGEIVFDVPNTKDFEIRHAYTVHSIQGETAQGNVYIDFSQMYNPQMLYTAISRAKYLSQIILV